jgi:glucose-1-phosphate thymidylyltransferase
MVKEFSSRWLTMMDRVAETWFGAIDASRDSPALYPATVAVPKCLLPVFNKPLIYYPLALLMLAGIRRYLVLVAAGDTVLFRRLLGDGHHLGLKISYMEISSQSARVSTLLRASAYDRTRHVAWISGDFMVAGNHAQELLAKAVGNERGATIFLRRASEPGSQGVASSDPMRPTSQTADATEDFFSNLSVMDVSFYSRIAISIAEELAASRQTSVPPAQLFFALHARGLLSTQLCTRQFAPLDTSTLAHLNTAANFIQSLEALYGSQIGSPEDIASARGYVPQ